jgi:glycosyltransferase involved in cell wall biosynthesis
LPADSRNKGVALARGAWIALLDADDTWRPGKLATVRAAIAADPGVDIVCHDVEIVDASGAVTGKRAYRLDERPAFEQLLYRGNLLSTSAVTVRASALRAAGGFDTRPEYFTVEDFDLWLRLTSAGSRIAIVEQVLGAYLVHPGGASSRLTRHYDALMRVFDDRAADAARAGSLDLRAALARRRRSRLAEARDLVRQGAFADAVGILAALPAQTAAAGERYEAAAAGDRGES